MSLSSPTDLAKVHYRLLPFLCLHHLHVCWCHSESQPRACAMTKVLFIEKQVDYEPQGIMSMSSVLKQGGHDVQLAIAAQEDPIKFAKEYQPDIVAYSTMTGSHRYFIDLNLKVKEALGSKVFSIIGGPHPTFFPEYLNESGV